MRLLINSLTKVVNMKKKFKKIEARKTARKQSPCFSEARSDQLTLPAIPRGNAKVEIALTYDTL
jgi:hypothetical protein